MARKNRPVRSTIPIIPKQWRTFPRRPWPISTRRHTKLRAPSAVHYDCYLLRNVSAPARYILLIIASRHGHRLAGVTTRHIDAQAGTMSAAHTLIDANVYRPALASDDMLTARVAKALHRIMSDGADTYLRLPDKVSGAWRSVIYHWMNDIRREPNTIEKASPLKLPDIL